jgi:hypothetical protein
MRLRDWRPSDEHGHVPVHRWVVRARVSDGAIVRELWFDDRDEADAFLFSRIMGTPWPHYEPLEYPATWQIFTNVTLTTPLGANTTYNVPADYIAASSRWDVIAAGGSGSAVASAAAQAGAGGAFSRSTNVALTPGGTTTFNLGAGGASVTTAFLTVGNAGADAWFGGATLAASIVGAKAGGGGPTASNQAAVGGAAASGIASGAGLIRNSGGNGGKSSVAVSNGGGGAGGPNGNGVAPADGVSGNGPGAAGDAGFGGAGGVGTVGANGTNLGGGIGAGGGGAGNDVAPGAFAGGFYGAGGGGIKIASQPSGAGQQSVIFGVYNATAAGSLRYNMPMMGI